MRQLARERCNSKLAFITRQDLREVESDDDTFLLAIGAPIGTTLNVPSSTGPESVVPKYELYVKSSGGPMTLNLVTADPGQLHAATPTIPLTDNPTEPPPHVPEYFLISPNQTLCELYRDPTPANGLN
eukprot:TRINITY_DN1836_c0_g1_i8.p1 TRINITY_DN1836_c0_g1~~TRINITY_DN1836_c0_g1_i8.p1  ORF type:complete len:128 (+),score=18.33 TRINITY_DN1836_c0_g1_i8:255-638(+)